MLGLPPGPAEDNDDPVIWPENVEVSELWMVLDSQWRLNIGMAGSQWSAPDHSNVLAAMIALNVARVNRKAIFNAICEMEQAALAVLNRPE